MVLQVCPLIEFFNVCGSNIVGELPASIGGCKRLRKCFLHENPGMTGVVPHDEFLKMDALENLEINGNTQMRITKEGKAALFAAFPKFTLKMDGGQLQE